MGYRTPNRTKTFFQQVQAGRPAAARQKLGAAMGAQSVLQGQTQAQNQENERVGQAQQQVSQQTAKSKEALGMTPTLTAGNQAVTNANTMAQATPVFVSSVQGGGGFQRTGDTTVVQDNTVATQGARATTQNQNTLNQINAGVDRYSSALDPYSSEKLTDELSDLYGKASDQLRESELNMTERNLGRLADESAFEQDQTDLARVLAERDSNIGKLRSLYGVGYDTGKFGALDSNLLQGQLNDLASESRQNLETRERSRVAGDKVRESYLENIDSSRKELDSAKADTEKKIKTLNDEISKAKVALEELRGRTGAEAEKARIALQESIMTKTKEKDRIAASTSKIIAGHRPDAYTSGGDSLIRYMETTTNPRDVTLIRDLGSAIGSGKNNSPQQLGGTLLQLSPEALASIDPRQSRIPPDAVQFALQNTKDPKSRAQLQRIMNVMRPPSAAPAPTKPKTEAQARQDKVNEGTGGDGLRNTAKFFTGGLSEVGRMDSDNRSQAQIDADNYDRYKRGGGKLSFDKWVEGQRRGEKSRSVYQRQLQSENKSS